MVYTESTWEDTEINCYSPDFSPEIQSNRANYIFNISTWAFNKLLKINRCKSLNQATLAK